MDEKRKRKFQVIGVVLMIVLLAAAFVLFFLGHYMVAFALFGIFMLVLNFVSNWKGLDNADYVYRKVHKHNEKW